MRRTLAISITLAVLVGSLTAGTVLATKETNTCPPFASSGYFIVDVDEWWEITVVGIEQEGFTEGDDAFAQSVGFADWADLEYFVKVTQWAAIDKNDNGLVCMKRRPHTPGNPYYFFNGVDDQSSSPQGGGSA
jgi:hypothetical protein